MKRVILHLNVLFVLKLFVLFSSHVYCQNSQTDFLQSTIIELPNECKLVLDTTINENDSLSIKIVDGIENLLSETQNLLPNDSITITLYISSVYILPVWGIGARTMGDDFGERVELYYDPNHPNFKIEYIFQTLAHEFHHVGRIRNPDFELNILECMVNEGLADHFMREIYNCDITPWSGALTDEQIQENIPRVIPIMLTKFDSWTTEFDEDYFGKWMLGNDDSIPGWTGYSIGWHIVKNYLAEHPEETAASLVWTHAEIIASSTPELLIDNENK